MVLPTLTGVASARTRSPDWALLRWLMLRCIPATRRKPDARWAPMLASASAIRAETPPCNTLNGCPTYKIKPNY